METNQALLILEAAGFHFEVVFEGEKDDCRFCQAKENRQAA
jgi:hypothetical protein